MFLHFILRYGGMEEEIPQVVERETLLLRFLSTIVACYVKWERLLIMKPHILCTDHNDIVTLSVQNTAADAMTMRWRNWLARFPFIINIVNIKLYHHFSHAAK